MSSPFLTVVIPYYNHEEYVADCIESVLNQTFRDFELIVIDDGSTDNGCAVIQELSKKHGFNFIQKSNEGVSATLNLGLKLARGKYFCAVASDDILNKNKFMYQINFMAENNVVCSSARSIAFSDKGIPKSTLGLSSPPTLYREYDLYDLIFSRANIPAVNLMWKTDFLRHIGGYNPDTKLEDFDLLLRFFEYQKKIIVLERVLAFSRVHGKNVSSNRRMIFNEKVNLIKSKIDVVGKANFLIAKHLVLFQKSISCRDFKLGASCLFAIFELGGFNELRKMLFFILRQRFRDRFQLNSSLY